MTGPIQHDIHMGDCARTALRRARALEVYRTLLAAYPTTAGAVNRVAECLGEEIRAPGARTALLVVAWARTPAALRQAERATGTNNPAYLVAALEAVLTPLREALALHVSVGGANWRPEHAPDWREWRAAHPGQLDIDAAAPETICAARCRALERWALGPFLIDINEIAAQWPDSAKAG